MQTLPSYLPVPDPCHRSSFGQKHMAYFLGNRKVLGFLKSKVNYHLTMNLMVHTSMAQDNIKSKLYLSVTDILPSTIQTFDEVLVYQNFGSL